MRPQDRAQAEELFHQALPLDPVGRATLLAEISTAHPDLAEEVKSLLAAHDTEGVLDRLTPEIATEPFGPGRSAHGSTDGLKGTSIGQYEVAALIGRGGMGDVYQARDSRLGRDVALKFLPVWLSRDPSARDRFLVEARVVSSIDHPNVCTLLEMGDTDEGHMFLVMPFYEGETLNLVLESGPLSADKAVDLALQTAQGLSAAHERGIVHRDIKPANLLITREGRVKILDFGIAKLVDVNLTGRDQQPGTARYMSPEQAAGRPVDARSDLWSLGLVLFEMLTGERPAAVADQSGLSSALSEVPMGLAGVIRRLLSLSPDDRYPDAHSLARDLTVLASGSGALAAHPTPMAKRILAGLKRRQMFRVAATALFLLGVGVWIVFGRSGGSDAGTDARVGSEVQASDFKRIAVLPFTNVNGDEDNRLMAVGVHADLNSQLQKISVLRLTAGGSVREYENTDKSFEQIADELGVEFLLEGSVQSATDQVRVIVSLVDAATAEQLWTNTFNEFLTSSNLLDIQSNIARQVVDALETRLTPQDVAALDGIAPGSDLAAQTWYYRAIELNEASIIITSRGARDYLLRAVEIDPGYVAAWSLLARMESRVAELEYTDDSAARAARDRTVQLAPGSVEAHLATGFVAYYANKDFDTALAAFREAERMAPSNADALWPVGLILRRQGKWHESTEVMKRAVQLDPRNPEKLESLRRNLTYVGAFVDADAVADRALSVVPSGPTQRQRKVYSLLHLDGSTDRARSLATELELNPRDFWEGWALASLDWFDGDNQRLAELGETLVTGGDPIAERFRLQFRAVAATPGDSVGVQVGDSLLALLPATSQSPDDAYDRLIALIATGRKEDLRREIEIVERLVRATDDHLQGPPAMAMLVAAYGSLGELSAGFAWMEELIATPTEYSSSMLLLYPSADPYRDDPRFDEIIAKREAFEAEGAAWAEARRPWLP